MRTRFVICFALLAGLVGCQTPPDEPEDQAAGSAQIEEAQGQEIIKRDCSVVRCREGYRCDPSTGRCEPSEPIIRVEERTATCSEKACESCNPCDDDQICTEKGGNKVSCTKIVLPPPTTPPIWPQPGPGPLPTPIPGCSELPRPGQPWFRDPCQCLQCPGGYSCQAPADRPICVRNGRGPGPF